MNVNLYVNVAVIIYGVAIILFSDSDENEAGEVSVRVSTYIYIAHKMSFTGRLLAGLSLSGGSK